jgi:hypothetical protein
MVRIWTALVFARLRHGRLGEDLHEEVDVTAARSLEDSHRLLKFRATKYVR